MTPPALFCHTGVLFSCAFMLHVARVFSVDECVSLVVGVFPVSLLFFCVVGTRNSVNFCVALTLLGMFLCAGGYLFTVMFLLH